MFDLCTHNDARVKSFKKVCEVKTLLVLGVRARAFGQCLKC